MWDILSLVQAPRGWTGEGNPAVIQGWEGGDEQACTVNLYLQLVKTVSTRSGANGVL